jgi:hypothetical protein
MRTYSMGCIFAIPNVANPTPVPIASLKTCKIGIKQGKAVFRGNQLDIIDVGNKARDWPIEIEHADFRGSALQLVAPNGVKVAGGILPAIAEQQTIAAAAFTVSQSAVFAEDGGVYDLTAGKWMTRVASAPAVGQYSGPAAGVYTCNATDNGHFVIATYSYTPASPVGETTTVSNAIQGQSTPYKLRVYDPWVVNGATRLVGTDFLSVHFEEIDLDFKVEDFAVAHLKGFASQDMIGTSLNTMKYWSSEIG